MNKDNISIKEGLDRHFNSFYSQTDDWHFFLGIADYVDFIKKEKTTNDLILDILKKRDEDFEKFQKLEKEALKELNSSKNTLLNIIKVNKLNYDSLNKELEELRGYDEGRIHSSRSVADALNDNLFDIARNLSENGHLKLLDILIDNEREPKNIYGNFVFSKKLSLLREEEEILEHKKKTELWNAWNGLALVYIVIYKGNEELEKMNKEKSRFWEAFNFRGVIGEMRTIEDHSGRYGILSNSTPNPVQFKKGEYQHHLTRIHNYLLDILMREVENQKNNLDFDNEKSILFFNNKEVTISKTRNSNGHYLLKTIFKDKNKVWEFDEISEDWSDEYKKDDWARYYNAGYAVNVKVAKETTIKDFLDITSKTVGINKKYL